MKIKGIVIVVFIIASLSIVGCDDNSILRNEIIGLKSETNKLNKIENISEEVNRMEKSAFKLGAAYSIKAEEDHRYHACKTIGDVAELAWKIYQEKLKKEETNGD